jgi:hypothetical protein
MRWHTTSRGFKPVKDPAADRFSAGAGFPPIDHKVSGGRFGVDGRTSCVDGRIHFSAIGNAGCDDRLNDRRRHGCRHLFHCGTVEHRREQKTAADHQPADDDTTFHNEFPPRRRVLAGALAVMCPFGQPARLARPTAGSHNHLRRSSWLANDRPGTFYRACMTKSGTPASESGMLTDKDSMGRFMAFMQRSAWSRFICSRGGIARLGMLALFALLAGCEGAVTTDLATELPADPNITQVVADIRGLEFRTSDGGTETMEFRASEQVNLIDLADDNGVLRLFTSEQLSNGNYTGVRLLFDADRADDAFVSTTTNSTVIREFPLNLADGDYASLSFNIEDNERSSDSFTLVLDLRKSLSFDDGPDEYALTPILRSVETSQMSRIDGNVSVGCGLGDSLERGAVYLFQGRDVTPDDIDGSGVEPFATAPVFTSTQGSGFFYSLRYLPAGEYTLAVTCRGNDDEPATSEDLAFRNVINVDLNDRETITRNLP